MTKRIVVTGASGVLGKRVVELLSKSGHEIFALYSNNPEAIPNLLGIIKKSVDIFDYVATRNLIAEIKPTHLIHLAWTTKYGEYQNSLDNFRWLEASLNLVRAFDEVGGKVLIGAGTCMEYSWDEDKILTENKTPNEPSTLYGKCKVNLKRLLKDYCESAKIKFIWGKIFFLFGEGENEKKLISEAIKMMASKKEVHCRNPNLVRDFIYAKDAAQIFCNLLNRDLEGEFNISCGHSISLKNLLYKVSEVGGFDKNLISVSNENSAKNEPEFVIASIDKLRLNSLLDGVSKDIDIGIKQMIKSIGE